MCRRKERITERCRKEGKDLLVAREEGICVYVKREREEMRVIITRIDADNVIPRILANGKNRR
jgi:hypothetical protein